MRRHRDPGEASRRERRVVGRPERLSVPLQASTTFQACSIYPWQIDRGLGVRGICVGLNVLSGGGFYFDFHQLYTDGLLENPNALVLGEIGQGKSALIKTYLGRAITLLGRKGVVFDPKGEYRPFARAAGLEVIELRPGGKLQINPLAQVPGSGETQEELVSRRTSLVLALLATLDDHPLSPTETAIVGWAMEALGYERGAQGASLHELADLLQEPTEAMAVRGHNSRAELRQAARVLWERVDMLLKGQLAGMFDGRENTLHMRLAAGPGLVLDLHSVFSDRRVLSAVMLAAQSSLEAAYMAPVGGEGAAGRPRTLTVIDEGWAITANELAARFTQRSFKLARAYGVANIVVGHRLSDFGAGAADGSAAAKIADNLVNDTGTQVLYKSSEDLDATVSRLGLSEVEADILPKLPRARAVWRVRGRCALVDHIRSKAETLLTNTDDALEVTRGN